MGQRRSRQTPCLNSRIHTPAARPRHRACPRSLRRLQRPSFRWLRPYLALHRLRSPHPAPRKPQALHSRLVPRHASQRRARLRRALRRNRGSRRACSPRPRAPKARGSLDSIFSAARRCWRAGLFCDSLGRDAFVKHPIIVFRRSVQSTLPPGVCGVTAESIVWGGLSAPCNSPTHMTGSRRAPRSRTNSSSIAIGLQRGRWWMASTIACTVDVTALGTAFSVSTTYHVRPSHSSR
jgi:hypothetical protein